jgi:hypothetical protein
METRPLYQLIMCVLGMAGGSKVCPPPPRRCKPGSADPALPPTPSCGKGGWGQMEKGLGEPWGLAGFWKA